MSTPKNTRPVREIATVVVSDAIPSFRTRRRAARDARRADLTIRTLDPRVLETALDLAGGDFRRLRIMADGSIMVMNA